MRQQVHAIGHARIDAGEADELVAVFGDGAGRDFVVAGDSRGVAITQREHDRLVHAAHRLVDGIGIGPRPDGAGPRNLDRLMVVRQHMLVVINIHMAIDDHDPSSRCLGRVFAY